MDIQITDAVILGLAFFFGGAIVSILLSRRHKKRLLAVSKAVQFFSEKSFKEFITINSDNLGILQKLEAGDSEGAKQMVCFEIALFYNWKSWGGLSKEFDVERQKIDELAKFSPILAAEIKKLSEIKASRLTTRWSQRPLPPEISGQL